MKNIKQYGGGCFILFVVIIAGIIWLGNQSSGKQTMQNATPPPEKWEIEAAKRQRQINIEKQKISEHEPAKHLSEAKTEKTTTETSLSIQKIEAWIFTQYAVEDRLKSSESAKFPFGGGQKHVECMDNGIFIIRSYVDSKNSFGAVTRTKFFCKVQRIGKNEFNLIQLTFE